MINQQNLYFLFFTSLHQFEPILCTQHQTFSASCVAAYKRSISVVVNQAGHCVPILSMAGSVRFSVIGFLWLFAVSLHCPRADGSLSLPEKQAVMDYHNYHRALNNRRQLVKCSYYAHAHYLSNVSLSLFPFSCPPLRYGILVWH